MLARAVARVMPNCVRSAVRTFKTRSRLGPFSHDEIASAKADKEKYERWIRLNEIAAAESHEIGPVALAKFEDNVAELDELIKETKEARDAYNRHVEWTANWVPFVATASFGTGVFSCIVYAGSN